MFLKKRAGSLHGPPKVIGVVALSERADLQQFLESCLKDASWSSASEPSLSPIHIEYAKHKSNISPLFSDRSIPSIVDVARISDTLIFVAAIDAADPDSIIDELGYNIISTLLSLGLSETICFTQGLQHLSGKALIDMRKLAHRYFESSVGTNVRFAEDSDSTMLCRHMSAVSPKNLNWRSTRSYMRCESVELTDDVHQLNEEGQCSLRLAGYLRGQPLSVQSLIHITDVGTFPISKISSALGPFETKPSAQHKAAGFSPHCVLSVPSE